MASMSNYLENKLVDFLLRAQAFTPPTTVYFALCTASPTDASTGSTIVEVVGGNYARKPLTCSASNFLSTQGDTVAASTGTSGTTSNNSVITWSTVNWSATVVAVAICDALTAGNVLWYANLQSSKVVSNGDTISFMTGNLTIQLDN